MSDTLIVVESDVAIGQAIQAITVSDPNPIDVYVAQVGPPISIAGEYADNAAALAAGLVIGNIYRTGDTLKIVH